MALLSAPKHLSKLVVAVRLWQLHRYQACIQAHRSVVLLYYCMVNRPTDIIVDENNRVRRQMPKNVSCTRCPGTSIYQNPVKDLHLQVIMFGE